MDDTTSPNAMTEVALALAMAFFAMMVLAMVSMSVPSAAEMGVANHHDEAGEAAQNESVKPSVSSANIASSSDSAGKQTLQQEDKLVIFHGDSFYDQDLKRLDPTSLALTTSRVVLALPADLTLQASLKARSAIPANNLIITQLNSQWQQRLKELNK